jgi:hypothetical protein
MASNPYAQFKKPNPYAVYKTPGTGPKAPTGFAKPGEVQPLVAIPGGPDSPEHAAAVERARSMAGVPASIAEARARASIELATERAKQQMLSGAATLPPQLDRLVGDDFLKALPPATSSTVRALVDGRMAFPAGAAMRSPYWQQMLANVAHADPAFDAVNFNARSKTRADFTSGQSARNIRSLNTAIGHLGQLNDQIAGTASHGGFPFATTVNQVQNAFMRGEGKSGPTLFDQTSGALASELTQVFRGSGGAEADVKRYLSELSPSASMEQKQAAIKNIAGLLQSRLEAVGDQYKQGMGKTIDPVQLLNPHAQKSFSAILGPDASGGGDGGPTGSNGGSQPGGGSPYGPASQGAPQVALATGKTREVPDPQANALLDAMLRSGANDDQINAALGAVGHKPIDPQQTAAARTYMAKHPDYKGGFAAATKTEDQGLLNRFAASPVGTGIGAAVDGGLGGFTDEATGLINKAVQGGSISDLIAEANAKKNAAYATNPKSSIAGNIVGTGATALTGGMLLKGAPLVAGMGKLAPFAGGAAYGGISGAGQNNDDRVFGAGLGITTGLLGTGAGKAAAIPLGALARTAPAMAVNNGARRLFGGRPLVPAAALSPAERDLSGAALKAGPDDIRNFLGQASDLGVPASLADSSPELRELSASAVRRSPTAAQTAENAFLPRSRGQIDRFGAAVNRDLGPTANIPQLSQDLTQQAQTAAAPLYDAAYAQPGASSVKLDDLSTRPSMKAGLARAYSIAQEEGRDPRVLGFDLNDQGEVALNKVPSFQTLDYVKRGLDDTLEQHRDPITGRLQLNEATRAINNTKNSLLSRIDDVNPHYAAARKAYAGPVQARDALAAGQDAFSLSPDELAMQAGNQTPDNLAQMQLGFRSQLMGNANKVRYGSNPFDATLGNPQAEQRIGALYPDNPGNANLFAQRDMEGQLARNSNDILGNSKTAQRLIADKAFAGPDVSDMVTGAVDLAHGGVPVGTIAKAGLGRAGMAFNSRRAVAKADELAPMVFNTDPKSASAALDELLAKLTARNQFVQQMRPTSVMGMLGGGFGSSTAQGY